MSGLSKNFRQASKVEKHTPEVSNLPAAVYPLIGRQNEFEQGKQILKGASGGRRLLICGQSGLGSTRIALELANWASEENQYDFVIWINCQEHQISGGRRLTTNLRPSTLNDVIKEIAHLIRAEAALKSTGKDMIAALNARCLGRSVLLIIDGFGAKDDGEIEAFLLSQPANFDVILTSISNLGWTNRVQLEPWISGSSQEAKFLQTIASTNHWKLSKLKKYTALRAGRGVPSAILWSARLLHEGYELDFVEDLSLDGWEPLLVHFFEQAFKANVGNPLMKSAAFLLSCSSNIREQDFNAIVQTEAKKKKMVANQLSEAGFVQIKGGVVTPVPFATAFLKKRLSQSSRIHAKTIGYWMFNIISWIENIDSVQSWASYFSIIGQRYEESLAALRSDAELSVNKNDDYEVLFRHYAYYMYSEAYWDEFLELHPKFIKQSLTSGNAQAIIEVSLTWYVRIIRHREGNESAESEFYKIANAIDPMWVTPNQIKAIEVARKSLKSPHKFGANLAIELMQLSTELSIAGNYEWSSRAQLHAGNVWAENGEFDKARSSYLQIVVLIEKAGNPSLPWMTEMNSLSLGSLGILENRKLNFKKSNELFAQSIDDMLQSTDRATFLAEYAMSCHHCGKNAKAKELLTDCLELKRQLGVIHSVVESHPNWETGNDASEVINWKEQKERESFISRFRRYFS